MSPKTDIDWKALSSRIDAVGERCMKQGPVAAAAVAGSRTCPHEQASADRRSGDEQRADADQTGCRRHVPPQQRHGGRAENKHGRREESYPPALRRGQIWQQ